MFSLLANFDWRVGAQSTRCTTVSAGMAWSFEQTFMSKTKQQENHRLLRTDNVFLFPDMKNLITEKLKVHFDMRRKHIHYNFMFVMYFHGQFLKPPEIVCMTRNCSHSAFELGVHRTKRFHLRVKYLSPRHPVHIRTVAVEHPPGIEVSTFRPVELPSTAALHREFTLKSHSLMSSSIYHIDCSMSDTQISEWSGLDRILVNKTCQDKLIRNTTLLHPDSMSYILQMPYPDHEKTNLWTLELTFKGVKDKTKRYGSVVLISNPRRKFCNALSELNELTLQVEPCAVSKTKVILGAEILEDGNHFRLGLQKFENSMVFIEPHNSTKLVHNTTIVYKWMSEMTSRNKRSLEGYTMLKYQHARHSWIAAARRCQTSGMTLPHFETETSMKEFVSNVLNQHTLPVYAVFVGLFYKVSTFARTFFIQFIFFGNENP